MYDFDTVAALLPFLGQALGPDTEILLCDTEHILQSVHPISDRSLPGGPIGDMEQSFIKEGTYKSRDSITNYRALHPPRERLRSSSLFIKDSAGHLKGFLTVNIRVEKLLQTRDVINALINGDGPCAVTFSEDQPGKLKKKMPPPAPINRYDGVNVAIQDIIHSVTDEYLDTFGITAERLNASERMQIVRELDRRGVFLVKGSINDVAQRLSCSEATIYRYLQQLP